MNVLHVISGIRAAAGGTTFALAGLTAAQAAAGLDVTVLSLWREGAEDDGPELFDDRVRMVRVGPVNRPLANCEGLDSEVRRRVEDADIVHIHGLWESVQHYAAREARKLKRPYVVTPHGMLSPWALSQSVRQWIVKRLYLAWRLRRDLNQAAAINYTTSTERDNAKPLGLRSPALIEPNGVDLDEFKTLPPKGFLRKRFPAIGDRPILLFLGRLHPVKGLDITVPAFAKAVKEAPSGSRVSQACLVVAGPDRDDYTPEITRMAADADVANRLFFTGMLDPIDRVAALLDGDMFILSSYSENYGISVIEAMAAGLPVLVSDQVQCHPEVTAADAGDVLPMEINDFAEAISSRFPDAEGLVAAGKRGRDHVMANLGWRAVAERWVEHYGKLLSNHRG